MSKVLEVIGGILTGATIAVSSAVEKGCEVVSSAACDAAKAVGGIAEVVGSMAEDKGKNDSKGSD